MFTLISYFLLKYSVGYLIQATKRAYSHDFNEVSITAGEFQWGSARKFRHNTARRTYLSRNRKYILPSWVSDLGFKLGGLSRWGLQT